MIEIVVKEKLCHVGLLLRFEFSDFLDKQLLHSFLICQVKDPSVLR